ncbi:MAG TPA: glutamate synthase-related protein [Nitrososphaerales archaeon]|nr:glutamate synthase-related protein [Nitrososphaerales archaeon]
MSGQQKKKVAELSSYMPIPVSRSKEFWTKWKISHIRALAETGQATDELFVPASERTNRVLDKLYLKGDGKKSPTNSVRPISTVVSFASGSDLELSSPLYLGDMSFGALSGIPNIAIAKAADATNILAGTGEGGLQKEVANCSRITVQWASARFGVDIDTLSAGQAVVIKIGQGAKPGIGGHLPGVKVTLPISETRRIPIGRDAISPAPHHDIYSIEDLGQRILALKEAVKKPVLVKVGATNYIPYIASGIARMGASGIIIDGAGAGTGAAPSVIKNNVGIPIELAVASVDSILRREGLRDRFTVIAAGRVSTPEDSLKLIALGADITSLGTAALLALGCLMVHKCHLGYCPAVLTNKLSENQAKVLSLNQSILWLTNLVNGWTQELKLLMELAGVSAINNAVGMRDLLTHDGLSPETLKILGVSSPRTSNYETSRVIESRTGLPKLSSNPWSTHRLNMLREMAGTTGKSPAEAEISSMGSTSAPSVEEPARLADWLVSDGAQVTRPSIDPYREDIEIFSHLSAGNETLRLAAPFFFTHLPDGVPFVVKKVFARVAQSLGLLFDIGQFSTGVFSPYIERLISDVAENERDGLRVTKIGSAQNSKLFWRVPASEAALLNIEARLEPSSTSGFIIDEDDPRSDLPLEIAVSKLDESLKRRGIRYRVALLAESNTIRGADDIFKLLALGADSVGLGRAGLLAVGFEEGDSEIIFDAKRSIVHLENFVVALQKEIKLLAGASGVSSLSSSLVGNRELLRSIDLIEDVRKELGIKPSGGA